MTTTALTTTQYGEMSVQAVVDRKRKIVEVMNSVMRDGEHYGRIPGCGDKPALFKSGAEILATTFGLAPTFQISRADLPNGHREYQIVCTLTHIGTGLSVGEGVGSCSTMESKYRYRAAARVCPECGKATIIRGKAEYGGGWLCFAKKGGCGAKWSAGDQTIEGQAEGRAENPDPADQYNTVLKMAKKRAQVDCTLTAVGASDLLSQDLEDLPPASVQSGSEVSDAEFVETKTARQKVAPWDRDLLACKTSEQVKALEPKFNSMRRGSPERAAAHQAYQARLAELTFNGHEYQPEAQ